MFYNKDKSIIEIVQTSESVAHVDSTAYCAPNPVSVSYSLNEGSSVAGRAIIANVGDNIQINASADSLGTYTWLGPNDFSSVLSEVSLSPIAGNLGGEYFITFTNTCGTKSYSSINLDINYPMPDDITSGSTYIIDPVVSSDMVISVEGGGTQNGSNILQAIHADLNTQRFVITHVEDIYWKIAPESTPNRGLDVYNISVEDGANIVIWDYWGGAGQQWQIAEVEDGIYNIISRNSGKCLYVNANSNNIP